MKIRRAVWLLATALCGLLASCQEKPAANLVKPESVAGAEAAIQANLATLGSADEQLALEQKFCPVMPDVRLGEMGPPLKVVIHGQPLFVCCRSCARAAQEDADGTLAAARELKERSPKLPGK
jgi:hypothetical protein